MKTKLFKVLMTIIYIIIFNYVYSILGLKSVIIIGLSIIIASLEAEEVEKWLN